MQWSNGPRLNTPICYTGIVYCQSQGKIFIIGGLHGNGRLSSSIGVLDVCHIGSSKWTTLRFPFKLKCPRAAPAAVLVEDRFLVVTGGRESHSNTDSMEIVDLNPPRGQATVRCHGPPMNRERCFFGATIVQGNKIVVGGGSELGHDELELIEFNQNATNAHGLFSHNAQWKTHPTLKTMVHCKETKLFSLDPTSNSILVMDQVGMAMVSLENNKVVPAPFFVNRAKCTAVLLPAHQQCQQAGVLAMGGCQDPTSMEWHPLPDAVHDEFINDPEKDCQAQKLQDPTRHGIGGQDFELVADGPPSVTLEKYIQTTMDTYEKLFGRPPKEYSSPLLEAYDPEMDDSALLERDGQLIYVSLIGSVQMMVTMGRFDIQRSVAIMSQFCQGPRKGHMKRVKQVVGYIKKHQNAAIGTDMDGPNSLD